MIKAILPDREPDDYGEGHFKASRGKRTHNGVDKACPPNTQIFSTVTGTVTKLGYPYADDLSYRYVQVTDNDGLDHRMFYVYPHVIVGDVCAAGITVIGIAQNIASRYTEKGHMNNHIHYEIKKGDEYLNPEEASDD